MKLPRGTWQVRKKRVCIQSVVQQGREDAWLEGRRHADIQMDAWMLAERGRDGYVDDACMDRQLGHPDSILSIRDAHYEGADL